MATKDKELIEQFAFHMAEEMGQLGHHEDRWYSIEQRRRFERHAKNVITLLRNGGVAVESRA